MLLKKSINMYQSQLEIFNFITTTKKYLALIHTMLGSGKTSMVLPLCGWLLTNNKSNPNTKILYCCPNEVVLLEVAHMIYGMGIKFAIVIYDINENKLDYKWSTFVDPKNPKASTVIYLCDIFVARMILEEQTNLLNDKHNYLKMSKKDPINYPLLDNKIPNVPDYILVCDEPTKDADSQNGFLVDTGFSIVTEVFVDLMKHAPPRTILMSATLPTEIQLHEFYNSVLEKNAGMILKSFASSEAKIGCS